MEKLLPPILTTTLALTCAQAFAADAGVFDPGSAEYRRIPSKQGQGRERDQGKQVRLTPKFPVRIETDNSEIKSMIEEYLPLITQQQEEELDGEQVGFLAEEAPDNVKTMLRTKGYFNSSVSIRAEKGGYVISVTPGPRTKIDNVSVAILGGILTDENLADYYKRAMEKFERVGSG